MIVRLIHPIVGLVQEQVKLTIDGLILVMEYDLHVQIKMIDLYDLHVQIKMIDLQ